VRNFLLLFLACSASVCSANTVILSLTALPTVYESGSYSTTTDQTYNGYSTATIAGIPFVQIMCDYAAVDTTIPSGPFIFDYSTVGGAEWATTVAFETGETLTNTSGGTIDGVASSGTIALTELQAYQTAAVLLVTLENIGSPTADQITDYQYAVWNLFDSTIALNSNQITDQFNAAQIVTSSLIENQTATADAAARLAIYTAIPVNSNQEFLGLTTTVSTPEPCTSISLVALSAFLLNPKARSALRRKTSVPEA
jgi:hypothetical protein